MLLQAGGVLWSRVVSDFPGLKKAELTLLLHFRCSQHLSDIQIQLCRSRADCTLRSVEASDYHTVRRQHPASLLQEIHC
jgi:hypothetical protein